MLTHFILRFILGSVRAVQEIIANRNVNDSDENGVTALHVAAIKGEKLKLKLDKTAKKVWFSLKYA